jgi:hypothetical protein
MNFQSILLGGLLTGLTLLAGCASTTHRLSQTGNAPRQSIGISVSIDNTPRGVAPVLLDLNRGAEHTVTIEMPGYETTHVTLTKNVSGWVWGNLLLDYGGVIGLAVDANSGGLYTLSPEQVSAELRKGNLGTTEYKDSVFVVAAVEPEPWWKKVGQLKKT